MFLLFPAIYFFHFIYILLLSSNFFFFFFIFFLLLTYIRFLSHNKSITECVVYICNNYVYP